MVAMIPSGCPLGNRHPSSLWTIHEPSDYPTSLLMISSFYFDSFNDVPAKLSVSEDEYESAIDCAAYAA